MAEDMLAELTEFYSQEGIYSCEFNCKHLKCCKAAAGEAIQKEKGEWNEKKALFDKQTKTDSPKAQEILKALLRHGQFTEASSAYVGPEYESNSSGCRLLFLSLDPGSGDGSGNSWPHEFRGLWDNRDDPSRRTPKGRREDVIKGLRNDLESERFHFRLGPGGWVHLHCTHRLAVHILRHAACPPASKLFAHIIGIVEEMSNAARHRSKKLAEVTPYFALANVVKCSIGRFGNGQAPDQMYTNCTEYLNRELRILKPDVILTQGDWAAAAVFGDCKDRSMEKVIDDKRTLCIRTYHPSYFGGFWKDGKKDGRRWGDYIDKAADFMKKRCPPGTDA